MRIETLANYGFVTLCGGEGTRIREISLAQGGVPKPLLTVGGRKLAEYTLDLVDDQYVDEVVVTVGHQEEQVRSWVTSADLPYGCVFSRQKKPGALSAMMDAVSHLNNEHVIIANGDEIRGGLNLEEAVRHHQETGKLATLVTFQVNNPSRHRVIARGNDGLITGTIKQPKVHRHDPKEMGLVNAGVIICDRRAFELADYGHDIDWTGLLDPLCDARQLAAYVAPNECYFNVGTPEDYRDANVFLASMQKKPSAPIILP